MACESATLVESTWRVADRCPSAHLPILLKGLIPSYVAIPDIPARSKGSTPQAGICLRAAAVRRRSLFLAGEELPPQPSPRAGRGIRDALQKTQGCRPPFTGGLWGVSRCSEVAHRSNVGRFLGAESPSLAARMAICRRAARSPGVPRRWQRGPRNPGLVSSAFSAILCHACGFGKIRDAASAAIAQLVERRFRK